MATSPSTKINTNNERLREAISNRNVFFVEAALKDGANVNYMFENTKEIHAFQTFPYHEARYLPVLALAVNIGNLTVLQELIESGADVNLKGTPLHFSAMHVAARKGDTEALKLLIEGGADVHITDSENMTPLHHAAELGQVEAFEELVKSEADLNLKDIFGRTPMLMAAKYSGVNEGCGQVILEMIRLGAVIDNRDQYGLSPLYVIHSSNKKLYIETIKQMSQCQQHLCCSDRIMLMTELLEAMSNPEILHCLCKHPDILKIPNDYNRTVLHNAVSLGLYSCIKTLLGNGICIDSSDVCGQNLLHCAIPLGNEETIDCLQDASCDLHAVDNSGRSVLHLAAFYGHCRLIESLIKRGLDPNTYDKNGRNSLHYAVMNRQDEAVKILRSAQADCEQKDKRGLAPKDYLHICEKTTLTSQQLLGDTVSMPVLALNTEEEFSLPSITNIPPLDKISSIPGIGSAQVIKEFNMADYQTNIRKKITQVLTEALPEIGEAASKLISSGSSAEGTKVGLPDEIDFLISLCTVKHYLKFSIRAEGYLKMTHGIDNFGSINGSFSTWLWNRLMTWWNQHHKENDKAGELFEMPFPPLRHPKHNTCVNWVWLYSDTVFKMLPISIDLVPAIQRDGLPENYSPVLSGDRKMASWLMTWREIHIENRYIVPKVPSDRFIQEFQENLPSDWGSLGRISTPPIEVKHLLSLDKEPSIKNVYITAKCVRKPEICGFRIKDAKGELRNVNEYITSFMLKTVFLHLVEHFQSENFSLGKMVVIVYEILEECLEEEDLPSLFDPDDINIFAGSRRSITESLRVAEAMTRFVRMLYERDLDRNLNTRHRERTSCCFLM